jgi:hypothetical protein
MATKQKLPTLSPALTDEVLRFIEYHPARRFDKNLRKMILEFLQFDGAMEAGYLNDLLYDLEGLFTLLDAIQEDSETKHPKVEIWKANEPLQVGDFNRKKNKPQISSGV